MSPKRLTLTDTVCIDEGYDNELVLRLTKEGILEIEIEGSDISIRLLESDVNHLQRWLDEMPPKKGKNIPEDDESDLEEDEEDDTVRPSWEEETGNLPPVGDEVLVQRLQTAQVLALSNPVNSDLQEVATKYLKAQLTLPKGGE